ncbi:MAG: hypothetical protein ACTSRI_05355 [Promethearchaeota archaeon]
MFDDIDKYIKRIIKSLDLNSDIFDLDFIVFPESINDLDVKPKNKNVKGYKISYHFESGMDKPDIKIEGNLDEKELQDYLKKFNFNHDPNLKVLSNSKPKDVINASDLSLESYKNNNDSNVLENVLEPYAEINDFDNFSEIVFEVPGIEKRDIILRFSENSNKITFSASNKNRKFLKHIYLPFEIYKNTYYLDVNNGIAFLKVWKKSNED